MLDIDFYDLDPEVFPTLDLTKYSNEDLVEMAYFLWCMYPHDIGLMAWRKEKLFPLLFIDELVNEIETLG